MSEANAAELTIALIDGYRQMSESIENQVKQDAAARAYNNGWKDAMTAINGWLHFQDPALTRAQREDLQRTQASMTMYIPEDPAEFRGGFGGNGIVISD